MVVDQATEVAAGVMEVVVQAMATRAEDLVATVMEVMEVIVEVSFI